MFKMKYLTILLFLIIAISAISAVSAENIGETYDGESDIIEDINEKTDTDDVQDEILASANNEEDDSNDVENEILASANINEEVLAVDEASQNDVLNKEITKDAQVLTSKNSDKEILSDGETKTAKVNIYKQTGKYSNNKKVYIKVTNAKTGKPIRVSDSGMDVSIYDYKTNEYLTFAFISTNSKGIGVLDWFDVGYGNGVFKVKVESIIDDNYDYAIDSSSKATQKVTVYKNKVTIKAKKLTAKYKSKKNFKIKIIGKDKKPVKYASVKVKIYTGKKYTSRFLIADEDGIATFKVSKLSAGKHKVKIYLEADGYTNNNGLYGKSVTSYIKIQKPVKITVKREKAEIGGSILVSVKDKVTKKLTNGIKVTLKIKNGKGYKTLKLVTGKDPDTKKKGAVGYATNMLSAGTHKVKIIVNTDKYKGSLTSKIVIPKSAKYYTKWYAKLSKGKTTFKAY